MGKKYYFEGHEVELDKPIDIVSARDNNFFRIKYDKLTKDIAEMLVEEDILASDGDDWPDVDGILNYIADECCTDNSPMLCGEFILGILRILYKFDKDTVKRLTLKAYSRWFDEHNRLNCKVPFDVYVYSNELEKIVPKTIKTESYLEKIPWFKSKEEADWAIARWCNLKFILHETKEN